MRRSTVFAILILVLVMAPSSAQTEAPKPTVPAGGAQDERVRGLLEALEKLKITGYIQAQ